VRAQGTYVSDAEVTRVCQYLEQYPVEFQPGACSSSRWAAGLNGKDRGAALKERDELLRAGHRGHHPRRSVVPAPCLQRALGIGYGRAARLIDFMAEDGIVGEFKSGAAREVLYKWESGKR